MNELTEEKFNHIKINSFTWPYNNLSKNITFIYYMKNTENIFIVTKHKELLCPNCG